MGSIKMVNVNSLDYTYGFRNLIWHLLAVMKRIASRGYHGEFVYYLLLTCYAFFHLKTLSVPPFEL